jgi:hypothetical protein
MRPIPLLAAENGVGESSANRKVERPMTANGKENVAIILENPFELRCFAPAITGGII